MDLSVLDNTLPIPLARIAQPEALVVDLDNGCASTVEISQQYLNKYVGGPALCARIWAEYALKGYENPIVISGSGTGSIITIAFKSPANNRLTFNTFSGKFNIDYCAVIIVGKLAQSGIAVYSDGSLNFEFDSNLQKKSPAELEEIFHGCIATGLSADNKILFASAVCNGSLTGRGGLGYVMAEKKLKAICLAIEPTAKDTYDFSSFVKNANVMGWAPVDNITKRTDPRLFHLCASEKKRKIGDVFIPYQAVLMLGSNVGCYDIASVYERYRFCLDNALDYISMGNVLGWIREAQERGIVAFSKTVDFIKNSDVLPLMESIVARQNTVSVFADGIRKAADYYKNNKFSMEINGLECGPFDYRGTVANAVNEAIGNWFPVLFDLIPDLKIPDKVNLVIYNEELVMGLECLNINPDVVVPLMINKLGFLKKFLISNSIVSFDKFITTDDLNITDVFTVGQNCRRLIREINATLGDGKESIPDFFCIDPESNASDSTIVEIRPLINKYKTILKMRAE